MHNMRIAGRPGNNVAATRRWKLSNFCGAICLCLGALDPSGCFGLDTLDTTAVHGDLQGA